MRYVAIGFCVFTAACAGTSPTAPAASATSSSSQIGRAIMTTAAKGGSDLPFAGNLQATEAVDGELHHLSGAGNGTQLGRFTYVADITVNPVTGDGGGTVVWTAANGDEIFAGTVGQLVFVDFPILGIRETQSIAHGTGRFVGVSGTIIVERSLDLLSGNTTGSFAGTINLGR